MRRRLAILLALLASAALLGGCVSIKSGPTLAQQDVVGKVRATLTICKTTGDPANVDCPGQGNSITTAGDDAVGQVLIAFRVPVGAAGPATFSSAAGVSLTFSPSESYRAELQRLLPAPAGQQWVAYASAPLSGPAASQATLEVDFDLPPDHPFVGPFKLRAVLGARTVDDNNPADRPVACGDDPYAIFPPVSPQTTVCVDSPKPEVVVTDINFATRDFGVQPGNATASPGQAVALPFNVRGVGALPAGLSAKLSATTTLPGVSVAPSAGDVPLSNGSDTRVTVPVTIPAGAAAGVYDVAVTGRLENGQERQGVAQLTVRARPVVPDTTKPRLSAAKVKPKEFRAATRRKPKRGTDVSYSLSEAASVRVVVERCAKYAKRKKGKPRRCVRFAAMKGAQTKAGKAGSNSFRFAGRVGGKPLAAGSHRLALTPTDLAANVGGTIRVAFVVRR